MAARHNISGSLATAIISPGTSSSPSSISIANTHASDDAVVNLYVSTLSSAGSAATEYYILKNRLLQKGETIFLSNGVLNFSNRAKTGAGLYIKLNSSTSTADVIISS